MNSRRRSEVDIRPIPSGDEMWAAVVRRAAATVDSASALEAKLRQSHPDAVVHVSELDGLARPVWYVYSRRWFGR